MEENPSDKKRKRVKYRVGKKKSKFFGRRVKFLNMTYRQISFFLICYIIFLAGIFNRVIYNFLSAIYYGTPE